MQQVRPPMGADSGIRASGFGSSSTRPVAVTLAAVGIFLISLTGGTVQEVQAEGDGQYIADFAMQYVGYPYVYGGNTPSGFDCSGFTQYVFLNTVGIDIGHASWEQPNYGSWVDWGAWQSGDLVYFANTFRAGVSHTGIYVGGGMFVHAENEGTDVTVTSIYSDYYAGHYAGARRIR